MCFVKMLHWWFLRLSANLFFLTRWAERWDLSHVFISQSANGLRGCLERFRVCFDKLNVNSTSSGLKECILQTCQKISTSYLWDPISYQDIWWSNLKLNSFLHFTEVFKGVGTTDKHWHLLAKHLHTPTTTPPMITIHVLLWRFHTSAGTV